MSSDQPERTTSTSAAPLLCFWCLVAHQAREQEHVDPAVVIYNGQSCCHAHVNSIRGLDQDFDRYPEASK